MSTKLSFKEALDRPVATEAGVRVRSASRSVSIALLAPHSIERPVDFIRLLADNGVSLRRARTILDRLAAEQLVAVEIDADKVETILSGVQEFGVIAAQLENPQVDPRAIRDKQGLSQPEFACLYGLEVDTLKNWEQGRNVPDGPAKMLLGVIDRCPQAVIAARTVAHGRTFLSDLKALASRLEAAAVGSENPWDWEAEWKCGYRIKYETGPFQHQENKKSPA